MDLDPLILSRVQFALTIGFHFLFPPISIGLAWLLVIVEWLGWKRGDGAYVAAGRFFGKILGLTFAMGVATGIVMEFQFGTNWAEYSKFVGDIFGAPLAAEAVFAFFLESTFLGMYLFGRNKVSEGIHWFSILMVAVGATISAFWIIVANSWQQTPTGFALNNGRAELLSFWDAVFNPSTFHRFFHTVLASLITGAFFMGGLAAYLALKGKNGEVARKVLRVAVVFGLFVSVAELFPSGHFHAEQVAQTQPEKFATIEGLTHGTTNAPMVIFGIPDEESSTLQATVDLPGVLSYFVHGSADGFVPGMVDLQAAGYPTPPFVATFISFHTMVGLGMFFIGFMALGTWLLMRKRLEHTRWYLKILLWSIPLPLLACQLGWIVAEVGRQPWVVYRILKTADAFSTNISGGEVFFSIIMFGLIYLVLGAVYIFVLARIVKHGPENFPAKEGRT